MKYETIFLMVRVQVHADHDNLADIVREIETESKLDLADTANINVLETEILVSRVHNRKVNRRSHETVSFISNPAD